MTGAFMAGCDALDVHDDYIVAANHHWDKQLSIHSISQRKKVVDIEWEESNYLKEGSGFLYGARFSPDGRLIFACAAGRNDIKVFDCSDYSAIK